MLIEWQAELEQSSKGFGSREKALSVKNADLADNVAELVMQNSSLEGRLDQSELRLRETVMRLEMKEGLVSAQEQEFRSRIDELNKLLVDARKRASTCQVDVHPMHQHVLCNMCTVHPMQQYAWTCGVCWNLY